MDEWVVDAFSFFKKNAVGGWECDFGVWTFAHLFHHHQFHVQYRLVLNVYYSCTISYNIIVIIFLHLLCSVHLFLVEIFPSAVSQAAMLCVNINADRVVPIKKARRRDSSSNCFLPGCLGKPKREVYRSFFHPSFFDGPYCFAILVFWGGDWWFVLSCFMSVLLYDTFFQAPQLETLKARRYLWIVIPHWSKHFALNPITAKQQWVNLVNIGKL